MAYPSDLNPTLKTDWANNTLVEDTHPNEHNYVASAVDALKAKVGADGSAVTTSHDYKLGEVTGSDKAVGKTASQTLTNKTLTTPKIADTGSINDTNDNEYLKFSSTASAVNEVNVTNSATGSAPIVGVSGGDTDIDLSLKGKGAGKVKFGTANIKLPNSDGTVGQVLSTDGSGNLSFTTVSSPAGKSLIPLSIYSTDGGAQQTVATTTNMIIGLTTINQTITVNKLTFRTEAHSSNGTVKFAIYTYDGSIKILEATSGTVSAPGTLYTITLGSPVVISPGQYWVGFVGVSGNFTINTFTINAGIQLFNTVSSYSYEGILTVTSGTPPSTITPTSISYNANHTPIIRLDN